MTRFLTAIFIAALLGGCVVIPADYGYRDGGYRHGHYWHDHYRNWRY